MIRRASTVLLLLAGEVGALILALRVPAGSLRQIGSLPPEAAVLAAVRLIAVVVASWLTVSTLLYAAALATRIPTLIRGVRWITLPGVRRALDALVATTVVASSTLSVPGMASANEGPRVGAAPRATPAMPYRPHPAGDGITTQSPPAPVPSTKPLYVPEAAGDPAPVPATLEAPRPAAPPAPVPNALSTYVLRQGDNLWSVAASKVAENTGKRATDLTAREIGRYWVRLLNINEPHLRSGDPNVVYPGETVLLPDPAVG